MLKVAEVQSSMHTEDCNKDIETTGYRLCVCSVSSVRRLPDTKTLKYTNTDFYIFSKRKNKKTICSGKQTTTKKLLYVTNSPIGLPSF